ncbi:MAG: MFS transporter [Oscillospiraceae bacterium]|nr:MFS transporter [Oscillospiraceae bacterium]
MDNTSTPALHKSNYPWVIVITALFWSGLIFGLMGNTVGLYYAPVAAEMGWDMKQVSFFMTIFPIVAGICSPFAGRVFNKYAKTNVILAVIAGVWCLTYVWSSTFTQLWQWTVYGVITGVMGGFLMYIPVPLLINNWFTKSKGIALGIAAAFVNIIPAICNPIVTAQIAVHGWRPVRLVVGIALAIVVIPVTLIFVRKFPKDKNTVAWGEGEAAVAGAKSAALTGVSAKTATKSAAFWLALLAAACLVSCATINQRIASLATARGFDPVAIGMASSIIMVGGILGKFILGFVRDRTNNAITTGLVCAGFGLVGCGLFLAVGTAGVAIFYISILIYGFGYAGLTVVPPMVVESAFGGKNFGQIYANVSIATCVASSITSYIYAAIIDSTGGYEGCFVLAMCFYAVFAICVPLIVKLGQKLPREE